MNKEFAQLMESNITILAWLSERLRIHDSPLFQYPRQQLKILVRLYMGGRAMLKEIARRESVPASNLCAAFRNLERDGMVRREVDKLDRRNTWYSATAKGTKLARRAMDEFRARILELFSGLSAKDEAKLTAAMKTMNKILNKMKMEN